jgi:hypothetical protein
MDGRGGSRRPFAGDVSERPRANGCFIATPERACEIVERFVEENQLARLFSWTIPPGLPPEWSDEHVELMASEVIPTFP